VLLISNDGSTALEQSYCVLSGSTVYNFARVAVKPEGRAVPSTVVNLVQSVLRYF